MIHWRIVEQCLDPNDFLLLIGGGPALASIAFVHFGIAGCRSRLLRHWRLRSYGSNGEQQTGA